MFVKTADSNTNLPHHIGDANAFETEFAKLVGCNPHDPSVGGNTGSVIAISRLLKGEKVRVVGRDAERLQRFVGKGAEAFTADLSDTAVLTKAFRGARAAYLMLPPAKSREDQERESSAIAKAVKESGLRYAVHLSSYGAQVPEARGQSVAENRVPEQSFNGSRRDSAREQCRISSRVGAWTSPSPVNQILRVVRQNRFILFQHRHQDLFQFALPKVYFVKLRLHRLARDEIPKPSHEKEWSGSSRERNGPRIFMPILV
jgi:NAD(P)H-binding